MCIIVQHTLFFLYSLPASEMLAQCQMVWMLLSLSVGWTLGSGTTSPLKDRKQLGTITAIALCHVLLVLWEQTYSESHYTYHIHESLPGLLLVMLRFGLVGLFTYNLKHTLASERSVLRKDFYNSFALVRILLYNNVIMCVITTCVILSGIGNSKCILPLLYTSPLIVTDINCVFNTV